MGEIKMNQQQIYMSEHGQDKWLAENVFKDKHDGFFVDVGAYDGVRFSNTYYFINQGWSGLMIEPHPDSFRQCVEAHKNNINILFENVAISDKEFTTYLSNEGSTSGFRQEGEIEIQVKTLQNVLNKHSIEKIGLLDIDCEGQEYNALLSFDINRHSPTCILIECTKPEIVPYLEKNNYFCIKKGLGFDLIFLKK